MDSLGQMKALSRWAILENQVIHRCYAFWMLGVLVDHYTRCGLDTGGQGTGFSGNAALAFCTSIAETSVKPWTEILIRGFGNDQTMFGFIMLGAYQDSRPARQGEKPRVNLGLKDLFVFAVYLMMALPFAQLLHLVFGSWAWPHAWGDLPSGDAIPTLSNMWSYDYMRVNSLTSDHRWYLLMVLEARILLWVGEKLRLPGWLQSILYFIPCVVPVISVGDVCADSNAPRSLQYVMAWIFRTFGDQCPVYQSWMHWYLAFYVWCFHGMRPLVALVSKRVPQGEGWAAIALSMSMIMGILMAMFHYPNTALESGELTWWAPLEVGVDIIQPSLFAFAMAYFPLDLAWWGNTTLGCYCFHFYFKDTMNVVMSRMSDGLAWDPTGMLTYLAIVGVCLFYTTFFGPFGHYLLLSPMLLRDRVVKYRKRRRTSLQQPITPKAEAHAVQARTEKP